MSFKDKVENNIVLWLLGSLLAGFLAGIAAYKAVIEIAQLKTISSTEYKKCKQSSLKHENDALQCKSHTLYSAEDNRSPLTPKFVEIQAGIFNMGSSTTEVGRDPDEILRKITLTYSYEIMDTEVTQHQFKTLMKYNPSYFKKCGANCPVESVTWHEAVSYTNQFSSNRGYETCYVCSGLEEHLSCREKSNLLQCKGYRLPTEAEWEYSARFNSKTRFWSGNDESDLAVTAWYIQTSNKLPKPVKKLEANRFGLYDILGNVWEWCNDYYGTYSNIEITDPVGNTTGKKRVNRGGGYKSSAGYNRLANRAFDDPSLRQSHIGFRLARTKHN
jgi:formylglycine-generating enzyme required for sulfatase activity